MTAENGTERKPGANAAGLTKNDYRGAPSTLCAGCGHNSISNQIIQAAYELDIVPEDVLKFSGIGCSSKSPAYFLNRSFGFNSLHGRMPSLATGAAFGDKHLKPVAVSGDGDTASIGMGQFKHVIRRNLDMLYIIENNGVYGLTKGQFSATAEEGLQLKYHGENPYEAIDICVEALAANATFVARSFAGDAKQVRELIKAGMTHKGLAVLDIISPCVTFNNADDAHHSYGYGKENETPIHDLTFIPFREEIRIDDHEEGEYREVELHDGSVILLKKLERDYDPTDRMAALQVLEQAAVDKVMITGLIYFETGRKSLTEIYNLTDTPLNRLTEKELRPSRESLAEVNTMMF
ncbi:MAG TPA: 2-oxoacid:ferredoxin oxidoreductase subunit beta [Anaerolineales bacterium]|nr:2-oxoacid:ferredoxin oxidoreductase subunit beta [Anaerolineales bacterium]